MTRSLPYTDHPLRVLLLCTSDQGGGAAEACRRMLEALLSIGVEARLLVLHHGSEHPQVISAAASTGAMLWAKAAFVLERAEIYLRNGLNRAQLFRVSTARWGLDISQHPWIAWANILHLHWINQGFLSLRGLRQLSTLGKPIFATLHDLWMATGICHLPLEMRSEGAILCPRYSLGCGACPLLGSQAAHDLSWQLAERKRFLAHSPFRYIAVSHAEARLFEQSALMQAASPPIVLPNPIDLQLFSEETALAQPRPSWYEEGFHYLTIVAARLDEVVKGPELLKGIARHFQALAPELARRTRLVLVGGIKQAGFFDDLALAPIYLGRVSGREQLAAIYYHSTAVLSTSIYETFGQTLSEALALGTPALSFCCGGPEDIIEEGRTGFLIPCFDTERYAQRLIELIQARAAGRFDRAACRQSALRFEAGSLAERLVAHYRSTLASHT